MRKLVVRLGDFINQSHPCLLGKNNRLPFELADIHVMVEAFLFQQIFVRAALDNLPLIDHQDGIRLPDGAQTMGDHKTGASLHQAQHGFLDVFLGAGIYAAGGLIQDQDAGICQDGASDG